MIRALLHSADRFVESGGGWEILALDGILLIPLVFAGFFFPVPFLIGTVILAVLAAGTFGVVRLMHWHHHPHTPGIT
ncbi:MAG: hypothetical protein HOP16_01010 [Acidobacteria bacterium]|nr:hypothetical protein [Acidobacteriota bacterium]